MSTDTSFSEALARIAVKLCGEGARQDACRRLSGGASQETWAFDVIASDGRTCPFILRRAPGGDSSSRSPAAIGLDTEATLIKAASSAGAPTPRVPYVCAPEDGLGDGFIMERLKGETIARKILRDDRFAAARHALSAQCGAALAHIHATPIANLPLSEPSYGADQLTHYQAIYEDFDAPRPVFDLAIAWLRSNAPPPIGPVLAHGDFRLGNLMIDESGLAAVLDWELAHAGDPREDIGWICVNSWRFGQSAQRVGGFGRLEDMLDAYADAGGLRFEPKDIDWWEALGALKWGVMCMIMYDAFRSGADPSVERAAIGRRVSETEIDLINLLERV